MNRGDLTRAVDCAEQAVRIAPERTAGWKLLAKAAFRQGDLERSMSALEMWSREPSPDLADFAVTMGSQLMKQNRIGLARVALHRAADADVEAFGPYRLLAQIAGVTGRSREVQACLVELIRRKAFTRDDLLALGSMNAIISDPRHVADILKVDPEDPSPLLGNALDDINRNHMDEGEKLIRRIVAAHPEDMIAQGILGELYADYFPDRFPDWHDRLPATADMDSRIWLRAGNGCIIKERMTRRFGAFTSRCFWNRKTCRRRRCWRKCWLRPAIANWDMPGRKEGGCCKESWT